MAVTEERVREYLAITCFASLSSILGALLVIFISRPSLKPRFYGILKSILAGAISVVMFSDMMDTGLSPDTWAFGLGGATTIFFVAPLIMNPPSGPNKMHPNDENLTKDEVHELQKREFDCPAVRERALMGGIVAAVAIGLRNLAYGVWIFSFMNWGRGVPQFPAILVSWVTEFVTLGAAVAVPIYFGTKTRWRTILAVAISTAAYPLGQYLAAFALPSPKVVSKMLEFSAGSMSVMSLYWMFMSSLETTPWFHCMVAWFVTFVCLFGIRFWEYVSEFLGMQ